MKSLLCQFANSAIKTNSQFKGKFNSLTIRRGRKRAIMAIGHKLLEVIFCLLTTKMPYLDPNIDYVSLTVEKNAPRWIKTLSNYGYI